MATVNLQVGPISGTAAALSDGSLPNARADKQGALVVTELHGRFFEQAYRGSEFSIGSAALTALSANTITLGATTAPIIGVYNPFNSGVNLEILQAGLQAQYNTLTTPVGPGTFVWAVSTSNVNITTGNAPLNRGTLKTSGSKAVGFPGGVALTGLSNNLTIIEPADFGNLTGLTEGTLGGTTELVSIGGVENFDGSLIIPPGGVLALLNTTSTTTVSAVARLLWSEVPII